MANEQVSPDPVHEDAMVRDPEDRAIAMEGEGSTREKNHDKTLADSFPTSDPPSSIPDPAEAED